MDRALTRRSALATGAVGLSLPVLAACGGGTRAEDGAGTSDPEPSTSEAPGTTPETTGPTADPAEPTQPPPAAGVVAAADVPVGGGVIPEGADIVVTQPVRGTFRGFDPTCTHQGCLVSEVTTTIDCRCHSSAFDLTTGAPLSGPAPTPLAPIDVRVVDGQVQRA